MYCPAGYVLNPRTRHCVKASGKTAAGLVRRGNIDPIYNPNPNPNPNPNLRRTVRQPRYTAPAAVYLPNSCPYGQERNPRTGRCVKVGGRTYKKLRNRNTNPNPYASRIINPMRKRVETEPYIRSMLAPLADRNQILGWTRSQCANQVDPLTGRAFVSQDTASLQQLLRLHNNTCTTSSALSRHVNTGANTIPGTYEPLNTVDYTSLAASQRRIGFPPPTPGPGFPGPPRYAFPTTAAPAVRKVPRSPEWHLYIAQDARSGPEFATVMIVDITKAKNTAYGVEYPPDSIRIDLGFIPVNVPGGSCSPQKLVDRIQQKDKRGTLTFLDPASGRWKPIAPFPLLKAFWSSGRAAKMTQLCSDLSR